jgi:hypothetical protein
MHCRAPSVPDALSHYHVVDARVAIMLNGDRLAPLASAQWHDDDTTAADAVAARLGLRFTYYRPDTLPIVSDIWPDTGPVAGGTPITLAGIGLALNLGQGAQHGAQPHGGILCRFGARPPERAVSTRATRESSPARANTTGTPVYDAEVVCLSPPLHVEEECAADAAPRNMSVSLSLTLNGGNLDSAEFFDAPRPFEYYLNEMVGFVCEH